MPGRKRRTPVADLSRAIVRFEQWRRGHISRSRIPAVLWKLAVNLAGRHGVARTAAALNLDYYSLKNRLVARPSPLVTQSIRARRPPLSSWLLARFHPLARA